MIYNITRTPVVALLVTMMAGLVACAAPERKEDYREDYAVHVGEENVSLAIHDSIESGPLSVRAQAGFNQFVRDYHMRSKGPLAMEVPANGMSEEIRYLRVTRLREILVGAGVRNAAINVLPTGQRIDDGAVAVLSFLASVAKVPECGNWESDPRGMQNWPNRRHGNFGCAIQRNIGLTIANPENLKTQETMSGLEGDRGSAIIDGYRTPAAAAEPAETETTN